MSGGGFFPESDSQSVNSPAKGRGILGPQSLKSLTIKQIQDGDVNSDGQLIVDGQTVAQISIVACVRIVKEVSTGTDYLIEDGTSSINARCWPDKNVAPVKDNDWIHVHGTFKSLGSTKTINVLSLSKVTNFNEVTFHLLESITGTMLSTSPNFLKSSSNAPSSKESKLSTLSYSEDQNLTPIQKSVYSLYKESHDEVGVNIHSVIRSLQNRYSESDIRQSVSYLLSEGLVYLTIDSDHARNISA